MPPPSTPGNRRDGAWIGRNHIGGTVFDSPVLRASVMLDELYRNVEA